MKTKISTTDVLNLLIQLHCRSLPAYLSDAAPWSTATQRSGRELLASIADDQATIVGQLADLVMGRGETVERGAFPMEFTDLHDLSLDHLVRESLRYQETNISAIEAAISHLNGDSDAEAAAQNALGVAKAHFDALTDYVNAS